MMMKNPIVILFALLYLSISGCSSPKSLYNAGKYNSVIRQLEYKAKKAVLNKEDVGILEKSISKTLEIERSFLKEKLESSRVEDWKEGYQSLDELEKKQIEYSSFEQLIPNSLGLIDIVQWDKDFSDLLYTYHVESYHDYYEQYLVTENKNYIIDAYDELDKVAHFNRGEINTDSLKGEIEKMGLRTIALEFKDKSYNLFELRHLRFEVRPSDSKWSLFDSEPNPDFTAYIILKDLDKADNKEQNQRRYSNDVIVRVEEQVDAEGNTVQVPITETFQAIVNEVTFTYAVQAIVEVEIYWNKESKLVSSQTFREEIFAQEFENYMVRGDDRALPPNLVLNSGSSISNRFNYDYDQLIEEALRYISEDVEYFIESF